MKSEDTSLLHAYVDGELDAGKARELEQRLGQDPALREAHEAVRSMSETIREKADYHRAPARLRIVLPGDPARARVPSRWLRPLVAFAVALIVGIAVGVLYDKGRESELLYRDVVASHVRATLAGRVIDVASSDQHTVKPWLSARLPFSPPVADFSSHGFTLAGARLDYVAGGAAAVLVYKRRDHVIDVFVSPGTQAAGFASHDGFNVERFARDGMRFWLVSDLNRNELDDFARLLGGG